MLEKYRTVIKEYLDGMVRYHYGVIGGDEYSYNSLKTENGRTTFEAILFKPEMDFSGKFLFEIIVDENYELEVKAINGSDLDE